MPNVPCRASKQGKGDHQMLEARRGLKTRRWESGGVTVMPLAEGWHLGFQTRGVKKWESWNCSPHVE